MKIIYNLTIPGIRSGGEPLDLHFRALFQGPAGLVHEFGRGLFGQVVLAAVLADLRGHQLEDQSGFIFGQGYGHFADGSRRVCR